MKKYLFYAMNEKSICFTHILLNALSLSEAGHEVKIIFEGASVKLPSQFEKENNKLYLQAKKKGLIAGICMACSKVLGVFEENSSLGLKLLDDMNGHAGMKDYANDGYEIISM